MIQIMSSGGKVTYGVNEYVIDTDNEVIDIPETAAAGSTAYSIQSETTFIKDNNGNWVVKNVATGSWELPDNILYAYDMSSDEFWNNYNSGNLNSGLYSIIIDDALMSVENSVRYNLDTPHSLSTTYDNYGWVVSNLGNALLQINEFGKTVKYKSIRDIITNRTPYYNTDKSNLIIDANGYLYLSLGYNDEVLTVNTTDITDNNNWRIINPNINNVSDYSSWKFSILSSYCDTDDTTFLTSDGGTFAFNCNSADNRIAYFKNGNLITTIDTIKYHPLQFDRLMVGDYYQNKFYRVYFEGDDATNTGLFKLLSINTNGIYDEYILNERFEFPYTGSHPYVGNCQMFIRNDIIYIQFIINNVLYYFLFDTITNSVIQAEAISTLREGDVVHYYSWSEHNDIYHDTDFSMIQLKYNGYNTTLAESFYDLPFFLKIVYQDEASYVDLVHINSNVKKLNVVNYYEIFTRQCNANGQYLYLNSDTEKFHLYSLRDYSDIELNQGISNDFYNIKLYPNITDAGNFIITAIASSYVGCIQIDVETGNVISKIHDNSDSINGNVREYIPEKNVVLCGDNAINVDTLAIEYVIDSELLGYPLLKINNQQLYNKNWTINHLAETKLNMFYLVYKNNIVLEKQMQEI